MPQSLSKVFVHLVFSTKGRVACLSPAVRSEIYPYIVTVMSKDGCSVDAIGGTDDHAHVLFRLSRTVTIAEAAETVKKSTSKWVKTKSPELKTFAWQNGYAAFLVSESNVGRVKTYIQNQEEHHRKRDFQDELRELSR